MPIDDLVEGIANTVGPSTRFGSHLRLTNQFLLFLIFCGTLLSSALFLTWLWPESTETSWTRVIGFFIDIFVASMVTYLVGRIFYHLEGLDYDMLRKKRK